MIWRIGIIGFGNVGQAFLQLLLDKRKCLERKYGFRYSIVGIVDKAKGSAYSPSGLPLDKLNAGGIPREYLLNMDSLELIQEREVDVVVIAIPSNLRSGEPALSYAKRALENGIHVITTNKGCVLRGYRELQELAHRSSSYFKFEGTVLSGTPVISLLRQELAGCEIRKIEGILNGTTNFILSKMEEGLSFQDALRKAQEMGYAEQDASLDIDGLDTAAKATILANAVLDMNLTLENVLRKGIRDITPEEIKEARRRGRCIKLMAEISREGARVTPMEIPFTHPLARIRDALNGIVVHTDTLPQLMISGPGAGRKETAQAVLRDLLDIHQRAHIIKTKHLGSSALCIS